MRKSLLRKKKSNVPSTIEWQVGEYNRRYGSSENRTPISVSANGKKKASIAINGETLFDFDIDPDAKMEDVQAFFETMQQGIADKVAGGTMSDRANDRSVEADVGDVDGYEENLGKSFRVIQKGVSKREAYQQNLGKSFRVLQKGKSKGKDYEETLGKSFRNLQRSLAKRGKSRKPTENKSASSSPGATPQEEESMNRIVEEEVLAMPDPLPLKEETVQTNADDSEDALLEEKASMNEKVAVLLGEIMPEEEVVPVDEIVSKEEAKPMEPIVPELEEKLSMTEKVAMLFDEFMPKKEEVVTMDEIISKEETVPMEKEVPELEEKLSMTEKVAMLLDVIMPKEEAAPMEMVVPEEEAKPADGTGPEEETASPRTEAAPIERPPSSDTSLNEAIPFDETKTLAGETTAGEGFARDAVAREEANKDDMDSDESDDSDDSYDSGAAYYSPDLIDEDMNMEPNIEAVSQGGNICIGYYHPEPLEAPEGEEEDASGIDLSAVAYNLSLMVDGAVVMTMSLGAAGMGLLNCGFSPAEGEGEGEENGELVAKNGLCAAGMEKLNCGFAMADGHGDDELVATDDQYEGVKQTSDSVRNVCHAPEGGTTTEDDRRNDDSGRELRIDLDISDEDRQDVDSGGHVPQDFPVVLQRVREPSLWKAVLDRKRNQYYYYNKITKEATWEKPADFDDDTHSAADSAGSDQHWKARIDKSTNKAYYYNKVTNEVSWERPTGVLIRQL